MSKNNILKKRAEILSNIRAFFAAKNILEVETPLLCSAPVTDPFLEAFSLCYQNKEFYLQTSPEYAMKRLLCSGLGSIYQICKAFRKEENGRYHQAEFTMLEWYRTDFDHHALMAETDEFLQCILHTSPAKKIRYQDLFQHYLGFNPHDNIPLKFLADLAEKNNIIINKNNILNLDQDDYLNLFITHIIEPKLKLKSGLDQDQSIPVMIYDFPVSQCALAKIHENRAERFEVYLEGIELANGYHELQDAKEQRKRFEKDLKKREQLNYPAVPIDENLMRALEEDRLPACAGIALGLDRLIMLALKKTDISEVMVLDETLKSW